MPAMASTVHCRVAHVRVRAGLTSAELATRVGISRQALSAIESGRATPSTAIALRLAHQLGCPVENLFTLGVERLSDVTRPDLVGARVRLGRISGRWVAHPLAPGSALSADALVDQQGRIELLEDRQSVASRVLVAGCAPVLGVLAGHLARTESAVTWLQAPSHRALDWLAQGRVHIAGMHLADRDHPEVHDRLARETLSGSLRIIRLVSWREGLVTAAGNPLSIGSIDDLARPGLRVALRPPGSGAAKVLDRALAQLGGPTLQGFEAPTHLDAAQAVRFGAADVAVLVEPVASSLGLPFIPLSEERFELVVRAEHLDLPGVSRFLNELASARFAREVAEMGAYDLAGVGSARQVAA